MIQKVETLVVGAGIIGSSVAMHLAQMGMDNIRVIDFDLEGALSSSELNAGGVRATWVQAVNIEMAKATIEYFAEVSNEVGYKPCGYLWLHSPERLPAALNARERQIENGWPAEVWDIPSLRRNIPFLDKTDGIAGAIFAPRDGLINPNLLKSHYRSIARKLGVIFDDHTLLREVTYSQNGSFKMEIDTERFEAFLDDEKKLEVATLARNDFGCSRVQYQANRIINCAGPWAFEVAKTLGYVSPCFPVRRQISIFDCREVDLTPFGMIVDTSGVYFHPEAMNGLAGFANHDEPRAFNFQYDGEKFFNDIIWPALYERSTSFERLKHVTGWAGLYEVSPDECAIIGPVVHGEARKIDQVYEAHSFSGHGVMHSYSAGKALAERIMKGKYESLDISQLSAARFDTGRLIQENLTI